MTGTDALIFLEGWKVSKRYTPKGEAAPVLGRKFCSRCGKWRLLVDFIVAQRSRTGTPLLWQPECTACKRQRERKGSAPRRVGRRPRDHREEFERIKRDPQRLEGWREYHRIYQEKLRRDAGIPPRKFKTDARSKGRQQNWGHDSIPAGPFVEWLDRWQAQQAKMRGVHDGDHPIASLEDLADLAGCWPERFRDARKTGRISLQVVDAVLTRGSDESLETLYPESEYPALYDFSEAVA